MQEEAKAKQIVGRAIDGTPLTAEELWQRIQEAEARIDNGEFTTQEDLEKESEGW
ncbi:MAG: hypothetical protein ACFB10_13210 [Salibacteraceae bacterium]